MKDDFIGKRVYLLNPHPWAGEIGLDRWEDPNRSRNLNDQIGGQLNPTWVEWLMGFPIGWTELNASETP